MYVQPFALCTPQICTKASVVFIHTVDNTCSISREFIGIYGYLKKSARQDLSTMPPAVVVNTTLSLPDHANDVTVETTTSSGNGDGMSSNEAATVSATVASAVVFLAVFVTVVCIRRRMHRSGASSRATDADTDSEVDSAEFNDFNMKELMRQKSTTSHDSMTLPLWSRIDPDLKKDVKKRLIEYRLLSMGAVIGKGQFGMVHEALLGSSRESANDYGDAGFMKVAVKTLRGER